jgi:HEAT repeat protein
MAFEILGSNAIPALPELARIASIPSDTDWQNRDPVWGLEVPAMPSHRAVFALADIGPVAVPFLLALATNRSVNIQCDAVHLLSKMGTNALPAIPLLLHYVQDPTNPVAAITARTLGTLKLDSSTVVPALANALANKKFILNYGTNGPMDQKMVCLYQVFRSLGAYGPQARPALPAILEWLQIDDQFTPQWAADTLSNFPSESQLVVPALMKCLESPNQYLVRSAAQSLGAFGSSATSAVPALINVSERTNLMRPVRYGAGRALERVTNSVRTPVSESSAR